ncbi:hypothetical protein ASF44_21455 [Pseudorhodoferax sp. Leaf274]|nr:hypothetical protein ASF44_21455 [Pseudorhodoferax sp. Leaf274]
MAYEKALLQAPESVRERVSVFTSYANPSTGQWFLRSASGVELWRTPLPPPPASAAAQPMPRVEAKAQQNYDMVRKLGLANSEAVQAISENVLALLQRVERLEAEVSEARARMDLERRGITFRGIWQVAIDYEQGAIVTYSERAYVASKAIRSGGQPPSRNGSGWLHMFDQSEVPR